jgi:hypothetical protein
MLSRATHEVAHPKRPGLVARFERRPGLELIWNRPDLWPTYDGSQPNQMAHLELLELVILRISDEPTIGFDKNRWPR